jgi:hypothetical protein
MATSNPLGSPVIRDLTPKPAGRSDQTAAGYSIPLRKRSAVMKDFKEIAGPLRGKNRENA